MALSLVKTCCSRQMSGLLRRCVEKTAVHQKWRAFILPTSQAMQQLKEQPLEDETEGVIATVDPLSAADFFGVSQLVNMRELFAARVHIGHKCGVRHPHMQPYLFGSRLGVDVIDLSLTLPRLHAALNFAAHIAARKGIVLFISHAPQTLPLVERAARACGEYAHCRRWRGGTFTNSTRLYGAVTRLPDLCIMVGTHNAVFGEHCAVIEAAKLNIPTAAVVDTSADPRLITYPVPGNDDSPAAIALYCRLFAEAVRRGKAWRTEQDTRDGTTN